MSITVKHEGTTSTITLDAPPLNLLTIELIDQLIEAHQEADAHSQTRVIVTKSAVPAMFSNGLDPVYVLKRSEEERIPVFRAIGRLIHELFALSKPHLALVTGPAMAGGAILAIPADFRFFDKEHGRLSFSEPKVGLPIPEPLVSVISHFCSPRYLREVVMLAKNMDATWALEAGIADGIGCGDEYVAMVEKQIDRLARLSPSVLAETKRGIRKNTLKLTKTFAEEGLASFDRYVGDGYLGEGLSALLEKRFPNFIG